jgi:hypothetical protein
MRLRSEVERFLLGLALLCFVAPSPSIRNKASQNINRNKNGCMQ